jgi:hypothetical protein
MWAYCRVLVERFMEAAWEEVVFRAQTCLLDPSGDGLPRGLGDLELHRSRSAWTLSTMRLMLFFDGR